MIKFRVLMGLLSLSTLLAIVLLILRPASEDLLGLERWVSLFASMESLVIVGIILIIFLPLAIAILRRVAN